MSEVDPADGNKKVLIVSTKNDVENIVTTSHIDENNWSDVTDQQPNPRTNLVSSNCITTTSSTTTNAALTSSATENLTNVATVSSENKDVLITITTNEDPLKNPFTASGKLSRKADYIISHSTITRKELRISDPDIPKNQPHAQEVEEQNLISEKAKLIETDTSLVNGYTSSPIQVEVAQALLEAPLKGTAEQIKIESTKRYCGCCKKCCECCGKRCPCCKNCCAIQ